MPTAASTQRILIKARSGLNQVAFFLGGSSVDFEAEPLFESIGRGDTFGADLGSLHAIPMEIARNTAFFQDHYFGTNASGNEWRRRDSAWLEGSSELALALDSATNNTSLVLAIEFPDGDALLFVADAQVGNWLSWQELKWTMNGRVVTGPDLLRRTIFYKVGHHGSHNATLRKKGLEQMNNLLFAVIPVNHEMAVKKRWGKMPLPELVDALREKAKTAVLRSDEDPKEPIDGVLVEKLFFEITV
jgi:hypothetical protein